MGLLKPIGANVEKDTPTLSQEYDGLVVNNLDPLMLGRIQVTYSLVEDVKDEKDLPWCYPTSPVFLGNSKDSIMFSVPEIGSEVKVYFPTQDKYMPYYKGTSFSENNMCTFFADEDYPNVYGFKDSIGNFFRVNKNKKTIMVQHTSSANMLIDEDGSLTYTLPDGSYFRMYYGGDWEILSGRGSTSVMRGDSAGTVTVDCSSFKVRANEIILDAPKTDVTGELTVKTADDGFILANNCLATVAGGIVTSIKMF